MLSRLEPSPQAFTELVPVPLSRLARVFGLARNFPFLPSSGSSSPAATPVPGLSILAAPFATDYCLSAASASFMALSGSSFAAATSPR